MLSKSEIKLIKSLGQKKYREEHSMFIVEGEKMVQEAIDSDFEVVSLYYKKEIGEEAMAKISLLNSPSPALAVVKMGDIFDNSITTKGLSLALDSVRDPGNLGTILRIADWFGIERIYCSKDCVEIYNPKTIQSSMGAIFRMKVSYIDLKEVLLTYSNNNVPIYGTFLDGENIYNTPIDKGNGLIVMGSENHGISPEIEKLVSKKLLIPPYPANERSSESLNVAVATAIVCGEFRRR